MTVRPAPDVDASEFQAFLQGFLGELHVDLVGQESAYVPAGGVVGGLRNIATHCNSVAKKEIVVFEEHTVIHDFSRSPYSPSKEISGDLMGPSYSFSIYLPGHLPPSMELDDIEGGGSCGIQYQLRARLGGVKQAERTLVVVGAALSFKKYPLILQPQIFPMRGSIAGIHRGGYLILAARVETTHVGKGEDLHLSLSCRNRSEHYIQSVDVQLLETIHWNTGTVSAVTHPSAEQHHTYPNKKSITLASYSGLVLDGLQNENQDKASPQQHHDIPTKVDPLAQAEMHNDLMSESNTVSIRLPSQSRDSYTGKLVTVSHCILVTLSVKNRASDPHVEIPIRVYDPPIETHHAHPPVASRKIESIATTKWVDTPDAMRPHRAFEAS